MIAFKIIHPYNKNIIDVTLSATTHSKKRATERELEWANIGQAIKICLSEIVAHADRVAGLKKKNKPATDLALVSGNCKLTIILAVCWEEKNKLSIAIKTVMRNGLESVRLRKKDTEVVTFIL